MANSINPLDHPICLAPPDRRAASHWIEHLPFAMWITSALRPRSFVELGTYRGTSYCAFCQAISTLGLLSRAYAVDTWKGDLQNGPNGPEILQELRTYHDPRYQKFSTLLELTFDDARSQFHNGEIDLIHIDGYHTYDSVRHDFETWRPKLSQRGVMLFHDIAEHILDFGVWKFWAELRTQYPSFEFYHEHGLGVLAVGHDLPEEIRALVDLDAGAAEHIRHFFYQIGRRIRLETDYDLLLGELAEQKTGDEPQFSGPPGFDERDQLYIQIGILRAKLRHAETWVSSLSQQLEKCRSENHCLVDQNQALLRVIAHQHEDRVDFERSLSWRVTRQLLRLGSSIAPPETARRRTIKRFLGSAQAGPRPVSGR